jgi:hypothetical protein
LLIGAFGYALGLGNNTCGRRKRAARSEMSPLSRHYDKVGESTSMRRPSFWMVKRSHLLASVALLATILPSCREEPRERQKMITIINETVCREGCNTSAPTGSRFGSDLVNYPRLLCCDRMVACSYASTDSENCKDAVKTCALKNEHKLLSASICAILAMHSQRL